MVKEKELFEQARNVSDLKQLNSFIEDLIREDLTVEEESSIIAATAIAASYAVKNHKHMLSHSLETAIWEVSENLFGGDNPTCLRLSRLRRLLYPESKARYITITPEIFTQLQEEARLLLKDTDATDEKVQYWRSLVKGEAPPGIIIAELKDEDGD